MYHKRLTGSHYNAGYKFGNILYKNNIILSHYPSFSYTQERKMFAKKCEPIYKEYYPEILEEINGIADGQRESYELFLTFLLGLFCFENIFHCTCIVLKDKDNIILGKNSDFLVDAEEANKNCLYKLDNGYAFNGNTTAFIEIEDGINEHGLAVGMTFIDPKTIKPGINGGLLIRLILEKCKTTSEAIEILKTIPISSSQNIAIADSIGNIAVIESNCEEIEIIKPNKNESFLATTNSYNSEKMKKYNNQNHWYMDDDWNSEERYKNAYSALKANSNNFSVDLVKDILSGKHGFMCQYDRKDNQDTVWSSIYDIRNKRIYRAEGNPSLKPYIEDKRLKFR